MNEPRERPIELAQPDFLCIEGVADGVRIPDHPFQDIVSVREPRTKVTYQFPPSDSPYQVRADVYERIKFETGGVIHSIFVKQGFPNPSRVILENLIEKYPSPEPIPLQIGNPKTIADAFEDWIRRNFYGGREGSSWKNMANLPRRKLEQAFYAGALEKAVRLMGDKK